MPFHDFAATETSTLVARLLAHQSGAGLQQLQAVREALDAAARALESAPRSEQDIQDLVQRLTSAAEAEARQAAEESRRVSDEARHAADQARHAAEESRRASEEARHAVEQAEAALQAQREENARLAAGVARAEAEVALLRSELTTAHDRIEATERDFIATLEAHEALERAVKSAEANGHDAAQARAHLEGELNAARGAVERAAGEVDHLRREADQLRGEADHLRREGEHFRGEADHLRRELERQLAERVNVERLLSAAHETVTERDALARELEQTAARARGMEGELSAARDAVARDLAAASARGHAIEAYLAAAIAAVQQHDAIVGELELSRARIATLETNGSQHAEQVRQLQVRLDESLQAEAKLREAVARTAEAPKTDDQTETLRWELERMVSLFDASVRAVNEMTSAKTSNDLLAELVKRLSIQFSRVALFRPKGQRLEGDHQMGFEGVDIAKVAIPFTAESLLTRAMKSGVVEGLYGPDLAKRLGMPFGGAPTSAVALPVALNGNTLAVVYADDADMPEHARGAAVHESSVGFAKLLAGEASVLLACHSHELKTLAELRQYATTLLQEAKEMYLADAQAGKAPALLRGRLKDNLECASQLYAYRAAMEGTAAAVLLDEQITAEMDGSSAFARDLAEVVLDMASSDLGITAEAS
jgi:hypothetical protein